MHENEMSSLLHQTSRSDMLTELLEQCFKIDLDMTKLSGSATDGAPTMIGTNSRLVRLLKQHLGRECDELIQIPPNNLPRELVPYDTRILTCYECCGLNN